MHAGMLKFSPLLSFQSWVCGLHCKEHPIFTSYALGFKIKTMYHPRTWPDIVAIKVTAFIRSKNVSTFIARNFERETEKMSTVSYFVNIRYF